MEEQQKAEMIRLRQLEIDEQARLKEEFERALKDEAERLERLRIQDLVRK